MNSKIVILLVSSLALASANISTYTQLDCLTNAVNNVVGAADTFSNEIQNCGAEQSEEITTILEDCNKLKELGAQMGDIANTCKNDNPNVPTTQCVNQYEKVMMPFMKIMKNVEESSSTLDNSCSQMAVSNLKLKLYNNQDMGITCGTM